MVVPGENSNEDLAPVAEKSHLKPRVVGPLVFIVLTLCILSGVVVSILAIWDYAERDVLYRALATLGVVALGSLMFGGLNSRFRM